MKKRIIKSLVFFLLFSLSITPSFAGYVIIDQNPTVEGADVLVDENTKDDSQDLCQVTFENRVTNKTTTRYYQKGYVLSMADLADATNEDPNSMYISADSQSYIHWETEEGQSLSRHISLNSNEITLIGTSSSVTNSVSQSCLGSNNTSFSSRTESTFVSGTLNSTYDETLNYGNEFVGSPDNIIRLTSEAYNQDVETRIMAVKASTPLAFLKPSFINGEYFLTTNVNQLSNSDYARGSSINIRLKEKKSFWSASLNGYGFEDSNQSDKYISYNGDTTIGLSNPEANNSEGGSSSLQTPYKYQNGSSENSYNKSNSGTYTGNESAKSYSINYCVTRFVLQNDVVFNGNITLGGITGYYGQNLDYSQSSYQGFIIGSYCEIDLNGFDLILPKDKKITSYGSLTDSARFSSSGENQGTLVMLPNSAIQSPFVIEDVFVPLSAPVSYFNNNSPFNFFRCPYLDCRTDFYYDSQLIGEFKVDLAGITIGNADLGVKGTINIIGGKDDSDSLISITSGKLIRNVTYDSDFIAYSSDLFNQRISYIVQNASISFQNWDLGFSIKDETINFDSRKYQFFIPYYFNISVINSHVFLNQEIVFMAGSHLKVDRNSILILSYSQIYSQNQYSEVGAQKYQTSGGLTFLDTFYYTTKATSTGSLYPLYDNGNTNLFTNSSYASLWEKLSETPAYCDFDGKIEFVEATDSNNQTIKQYHPFVLGGQFDIANFTNFSYQVNKWNNSVGDSSNLKKIQLFGNYFMLGPNTAPSKASIGLNYYYVRGFYTPPLMNRSNQLLVDVTTTDYSIRGIKVGSSSGTSLTSGQPFMTYDSQTGLISGNQKQYAFIPDYSWSHSWDKQGNSNLYCTFLEETGNDRPNDLDGSFWPVTSHGNYISVSGADYGDDLNFNREKNIFYHGSFVFVQTDGNVNGDSAITHLYRYAGGKTEYARTRLYTLTYASGKWELQS